MKTGKAGFMSEETGNQCLGFIWGPNPRRCSRVLDGELYCGDHKRQPFYIAFFILFIIVPALFGYSSFFGDKKMMELTEDTKAVVTEVKEQQEENHKEVVVKLSKIEIANKDIIEWEPEAKEAFRDFSNGDYTRARGGFFGFVYKTDDVELRDRIQGLIVATYTGLSEYQGGLEYICDIYRNQPSYSKRHMYRVHALLYKIAKSENRGLALKLATRYREQCNKADYSPFWAGIPLAFMERIEKGLSAFEGNHYKLSDDERRFLEAYIAHYKDSDDDLAKEFIDFAYYALGKFEKVLENKESWLYPLALFDGATEAKSIDKIRYLSEFVKSYPNHKLHETALIRLALEYRATKQHKLAEFYMTQYDLSKEEIRYVNSEAYYRIIYSSKSKEEEIASYLELLPHVDTDLAERIIFKIVIIYASLGDVENVIKNVNEYSFLEEMLDDVYWGDAEIDKLYKKAKFEQALLIYENKIAILKENNIEPPKLYRVKQKELEIIIEMINKGTEESLFNLGIYLREEVGGDYYDTKGRNGLAIMIFDKLLSSYPKGKYAEKALFLKATSYRRLNNHVDSLRTFEEFEKRFPDSDLCDDAIAEAGWQYLFIRKDIDLAKYKFNQVIEKFPNRNAADNAHYWLGLMAENEGDLLKAFIEYGRIIKMELSERLSELSRGKNNDLLKHVGKEVLHSTQYIETELGGVMLKGITQGAPAYEVGLRNGDLLLSINDIPTLTKDDLLTVESDVPDYSSIEFTIVRKMDNFEQERDVQNSVSTESLKGIIIILDDKGISRTSTDLPNTTKMVGLVPSKL